MSLVIAVEDGIDVIVAADSSTTDPETGLAVPTSSRKVRSIHHESDGFGAFVMGGVGDLGYFQQAYAALVSHHEGSFPSFHGGDAELYFVTHVAEPLRAAGLGESESNLVLAVGSSQGPAIAYTTPDLSVFVATRGHAAIGGPEETALGALAVLDGDPVDVLRRTFRVAAENTVWVRPPYYAFSTSGEEVTLGMTIHRTAA